MNFSNKNMIVLIGRNGSGKTYMLNEILCNNPENTLYISEDGIAKVVYQKNNITIDYEKNTYLYVDEINRGTKTEVEEYSISESSIAIINYCNIVIRKLNRVINKSQGQKKLENMIIFLRYNLNNIDTILFDEPENFFDEEYLKIICGFMKILAINEFNIKIATHSSRLLSILEIETDNVILIENRRQYSVSRQVVKSIFIDISEKVNSIREDKGWSENNSITYKLKIHEVPEVFDNYINCNIHNIEFYRSLFYSNIIIVEGESDREALKTVNEYFDETTYVFSANGKAWVPFYASLFLEYGKNVTAIIDTDEENKTHSTVLTIILEHIDNLKLIKHNPNLEKEYGIDIDGIGSRFGMSEKVMRKNSGWLKQIAAYYFFKVCGNWKRLEQKIFQTENTEYDFK
ncbi:TOPRIM nucleotidyl transferase/hydrolase domain-containing protein [Sedimentibacter sp.]|uniref:TOPRIM nucleotidyl transferase/hydrolase domain-containing protein n=1 Tax=Sedimentibacter sp. TaxID=1960295 RepID=UPI0028AFD858|nr:TOPRIM nucleotidyl transferase/hydrolase domain-containing protein [Sedimentibacter sp.]